MRYCLLLLILTCGCRGIGKSSKTDRDPLYGRYIPKTDLPTRESSGADRDPLMTAPTSGRKASGEPFRNSASTTTAGLAGRVPVEESGMSLGDRRTIAAPASGVPLKRREAVNDEGWQDAARELRNMRARYEAPVRTEDGYLMSAIVPVGNDGTLRRYEAGGRTAKDAAEALIVVIRTDGR